MNKGKTNGHRRNTKSRSDVAARRRWFRSQLELDPQLSLEAAIAMCRKQFGIGISNDEACRIKRAIVRRTTRTTEPAVADNSIEGVLKAFAEMLVGDVPQLERIAIQVGPTGPSVSYRLVVEGEVQ